MGEGEASTLGLAGWGCAFGPRVVLDDVTLDLTGDVGIDVLMGPVKTGKSTLMRVLAGQLAGHPLLHQWGDAQVHGRPLDEANRPLLLQQHARLLDRPVCEVLVHRLREREVLPPTQWRARAAQVLHDCGLQRLDDALERPVLQLPTAQARCVLVAALAAAQPPLLMVDEPTHGLPEADAAMLIDWLRQLGRSRRLLVALHHQGQARRLAGGVILLGGGHVLAHQPGEEFFARPCNRWAEHFLRTGSLDLPSPGAADDDLDVDAPRPFPLSESAVGSLRRWSERQPAAPAPPPAPMTPSMRSVSASAEAGQAPAAAPTRRPAQSEPQHPAPLPPPSRNGVELASGVGTVLFSDHRGPRGFHWIVPGRLAGSPAPGVSAALDYDLDLLSRAGVTTLITLTEDDIDVAALERFGLNNLHLSVYDRKAPSIAQMHMLLARMQRLLTEGRVLAVHCKAGLGRTGTVLAAWLIREGGLTADVAIERLRRIESGYVQSQEQERFLHEYEADLLRRMR